LQASLCVLPSSAAARSRSSGAGSARPCQNTGWEAGNRSNGSPHPSPKKETHRKSLWKPVAGVAALPVCWLRPPPLLIVPALRVLVLLLPVFRRRHPWQPRKRIRRNGAYVYHGVPKAFRWELANVFNAALVAKVLKGRGHLDVEKVG